MGRRMSNGDHNLFLQFRELLRRPPVIRLNFEGCLKMRDGVVTPSESCEDFRKVAVSADIVGFYLERCFKFGCRLFEMATVFEGDGEISASNKRTRLQQ